MSLYTVGLSDHGSELVLGNAAAVEARLHVCPTALTSTSNRLGFETAAATTRRTTGSSVTSMFGPQPSASNSPLLPVRNGREDALQETRRLLRGQCSRASGDQHELC
jgi:hypothetical protein